MTQYSPEEEEKIQEVINRLGRSQPWIENYAKQLGVTYGDLIEHATDYVRYGEYWNEGPLFDGVDLSDEFWEHYEEVTDSVVPEDKKYNFFSCSC